MRLLFKSLLALGVAVEAAALFAKAASVPFSSLWLLIPLVFLILAFSVLFVGMFQDRRAEGAWSRSLTTTARRFGVPRRALALLVSELHSLGAATKIFIRPSTSAGGQAHCGYRNLRSVVFLVLGLVVVETAVVHLAVPSRFWRILALVVSVYSVILLLGFYVSVRNNPHLVTPEGVVIRHGRRFVCEIPWTNLTTAKSANPGQGGDITFGEGGGVRLPVLSEVNVRFEVNPPVVAEDLYKGQVEVSSIDCYCDEKNSLLDSVSRMMSSGGEGKF